MDLSKLTPAPWRWERRFSNGCEIVPRIKCTPSEKRECGWIADLFGAPYLGYESTLVNAEFIALARNAFDVMMRRGWFAIPVPAGWAAVYLPDGSNWAADESPNIQWASRTFASPDPFTALVEADQWEKARQG